MTRTNDQPVKPVRVVVEITSREVSLSLADDTGLRIEHDRFRVQPGYADIKAAAVGRDVYNLLYQCASDAMLPSDGTSPAA